MSNHFIKAVSPPDVKRIERENRNVRLRIILFFCGFSAKTGQHEVARRFRGQATEQTDWEDFVRLGDMLVSIPPNIHDDIQDDEDTDVKTEVIYVNESSVSDYKLKSLYMDSVVGKYCIVYSKVMINIYIPSDNEAPFSSDLFFSLYRPKCLGSDFAYKNIDPKKSFLTFSYLKECL